MEYCWYEESVSESGHGPFATVEEAKQDIYGYFADDDRGIVISIAEVKHPDPEECVDCINVDDILERMDERAGDVYEVAFDESVFEVVPDLKTAEAALEQLLKTWAKKHVGNGGHWFAGKTVEKVELGPLGAPEGR